MKNSKISNFWKTIFTAVLIFSQLGINNFIISATAESPIEENIITTEDLNLNSVEIKVIKKENIELAESLKKSKSEEYDKRIEEFIEESNDLGLDETLNHLEETKDEDNIIFENSLIDEYKIDEETVITITPTEVILDSFEESDETLVTDSDELQEFNKLTKANNLKSKIFSFYNNSVFSPITVNASRGTRRKTASHSRTYYARALGQKVVSVGIGAEFTYNGSGVTARTTHNYAKIHPGSLGTWQRKNRKNGVQKPSSKRRVAYQQATFVQGLTYKGNGLGFQSRYLRANVECNHNGVIRKSSTSR